MLCGELDLLVGLERHAGDPPERHQHDQPEGHQPDDRRRLATGPHADALPEQVAADQRDQRDQQRHHEDRDRHPAPPPELVERHLVGVGREHLGGGAGAAARHHVDDVEVVDGEDERQQHRHDDHVLEPGQRDVPEAAPGAGAVHRGRLVELARDRLHAGQVRHAEEREAAPPVGDDHRRHRALRRGHEGDRPREQPGVEQHAVEEAAAGEGVEHPAPGQRDDHGRGDPRQQEQAAEEVAPAPGGVQHQGHQRGRCRP